MFHFREHPKGGMTYMTIEEAESLIDGLTEKELYALNELLKSLARKRELSPVRLESTE